MRYFVATEGTSVWASVSAFAASVAVLIAMSVFAVQLSDRRRRFAQGVTAWVAEVIAGQGVMEKFEATVGNASESAVFDVVLFVRPLIGKPSLFEHIIGTVPPGERRSVEVLSGRRDEGYGDRPKYPWDFAIEVRFTDAIGHRWRRDSDGRLHHWTLVKGGTRTRR